MVIDVYKLESDSRLYTVLCSVDTNGNMAALEDSVPVVQEADEPLIVDNSK